MDLTPEDELVAVIAERAAECRTEAEALEQLITEVRAKRAAMQSEMVGAIRRYAWGLYERDAPIPRALIGRLYWEYPEIPALELARAFGLTLQSDRWQRLLPPNSEPATCERCGARFVGRHRNRSSAWYQHWGGERHCSDCRAAVEAARQREIEGWRAQAVTEADRIQHLREKAEREGRFRLRVEHEGIDY